MALDSPSPWLANEEFPSGALLECVPNFSEGRDQEVIHELLDSIHLPRILLLDYSSDADHHRTVVTFAGPPAAVLEAAVRSAGLAARRIDLRQHRGVHLRMGAADVVPFVPLAGLTLERTAHLARLAAREIWERHGVPCFLYEAAALSPERRRLEAVRRGQFEGASRERRQPDLGGPGLHPSAGAAIVGARDFLVAFNLLLDTPEVPVARAIATRIRASSGGFPGVKAMGLPVAGHAQVTINITDYRQTPIERVYQVVKRLAAANGTAILRGELIGLIPRAAWQPDSEWFTTIPGFYSHERIVEERLRHPMQWPSAMRAIPAATKDVPQT